MNPEQTVDGAVLAPSTVRPSTRGELAERLKAGESCEVAGYVAEITSIMLRGWLDVENFTVAPSENPGWVVFRPNVSDQEREPKTL